MLLIALSGGSPEERVAIADRLVASGKGHLAAFAQMTPSVNCGPRRAALLRDVLGGTGAIHGGLIIVHCVTQEEAQVVRQAKGAQWHVYGKPSSFVPILRGDTIVTNAENGFEHVRDPLEALSELMQREAANKPRRSRAVVHA